MKPVEIARKVLGGDTSSGSEERLEPLMSAVDRLNICFAYVGVGKWQLINTALLNIKHGSTRLLLG